MKRFNWRVKTGLCAPPPFFFFSLSSLYITPGIQQEEPQPSNQVDPQNKIRWNEKTFKYKKKEYHNDRREGRRRRLEMRYRRSERMQKKTPLASNFCITNSSFPKFWSKYKRISQCSIQGIDEDECVKDNV